MPEPTKPERRYWHGIDYLRAFFSLTVVAIHTHLISEYTPLFTERITQITRVNIYDIVQVNIMFLAVPGFVVISMFLFFSREEANYSKDFKRLKQLFFLYVFWAGLWFISSASYSHFSETNPIIYIIKGGNSSFYYLFSLIFVTFIATFVRKLNRRTTWFLLLISLGFVTAFPIMSIFDSNFNFLSAYWNPLIFIPGVFAGKLIADWSVNQDNKNRPPYKIPIILIIIYIIAAIVEWQYLPHQNQILVDASIMPSYARPSPTIGAAILVFIVTNVKSPVPKIIRFLSNSSLGIYGVHVFILRFGWDKLPPTPILKFSITLLTAIAITFLLRRVLKSSMI